MPVSDLTTTMLPIDSVRRYPTNPRRGDVSLLKESLERFGQYRAVVVQLSSKYVLAGNHTFLAAKELGWKEIVANVIDVDDETAQRIVLMDNRSSDRAGYDEQELATLLQSLGSYEGTGYSDRDVTRLLKSLDDKEHEAAPQMGAVEFRVMVECNDDKHQAEVLNMLEEKGLKCQPIMV